MAEDVEKLKERIAELENQLTEEKEELEWDLKAVKESNEKTIQKLQGEIARLKKEGVSSSATPESKSDEVKMLTQRALMAERRVAELQEELKRSRNLTPAPLSKGAADPLQRHRAEAAEKERDELRKEKRALERTLEEKKNALERTRKELDDSKKLKKQLDGLKSESAALEKELRQFKEGTADTTRLQEEISSLKEALARKEDDWGKLSSDSQQNEEKLAELTDQLSRLDGIKQERDRLSGDLEHSRKKVEELETSLREIQAENRRESSEKEKELAERASEAEREASRLQQELAQVKVASGQMVEQRERETERLKSDLEEVRRLAEERDGLEREAEHLRQELAVATGERDELVAQIKLLRDDHQTVVRKPPDKRLEPDPFVVATEPAGVPRGAAEGLEEYGEESSDEIASQADLGDEGEQYPEGSEHYRADIETKRVRFADGATEQTEALPSPMDDAPAEEDLYPPAVESIDDERVTTQVADISVLPSGEHTDTRETSKARDAKRLPMAEHAFKAKKRGRGGLLLKAAFFGIVGGLLIAAAAYFFPKWFGLGEAADIEGTEVVADTPATPETDTSTTPPEPDKPVEDTEIAPDKPDEPDKPDQPVADVSTDKPPPLSPAKPDPKLKKAQEFGLNLIKKKKYKKALSFIEDWVKKQPDDPTMRYLYGRALFYRRKIEDASEQLEKAIKLDPAMAEAYYELGGVYIKLGQTANACACLKTFMKMKPGDRRSKGVRGILRKLKCSK